MTDKYFKELKKVDRGLPGAAGWGESPCRHAVQNPLRKKKFKIIRLRA
jgi:hypothetical protein